MASSSSNTSPVSNNNVFRYDVFLSFRGETRHAFTDHLYKALEDAALIPFRDNDDIKRGEDLKPEIERGIRESRASIVVLSEQYATSRWCLDELCLILEQRKKRNHFVLPIFYHVDPSHVRKQEESFEIKVKSNTKWTEDNVEKWKAALTKIGNMKGEVPSGPETHFLKKVVGIIEKKLDFKKFYGKANLVGMDTWRMKIDYWVKDPNVQILVVCGMGGSGKTTLAKHIVYSNWESFVSISILEDIGSKSKEQLRKLQEKLLGDILQGKKRKIPSVLQGPGEIKKALQTTKALIVLDDIVHWADVFCLLGDGTKTQSKIIVTTRESNLDIPSWRCQELEMKSLDKNDSLELLSHHAFESKVPPEGYDHLVEKALRYCDGNPLALEVLGSSLSKKTKQFWESRLNSFEKELHAGIHSVLIRSYESLPLDSNRELFLHIACFFVGKDIDYVVKILEPDYSALSGIETLCKSCLLYVSPNKKLMMHRMLQEMARTIVYKESPKYPEFRSRVWKDAESYEVLRKGKGSGSIEGLALDMNLLSREKYSYGKFILYISTESFKKMDKLKLLQLNHVDHLVGPYENFSEQLRWLCWIGFHLRAIPSDLCMENLVAIDMSYSYLKEFEPPTDLLSLKILNLKSSWNLREIRNIHRLRYLETLILWDCISLTHVTLGGLTCLAILNITGCKNLCKREEISPWSFTPNSASLSQEGSSQQKVSQEGSSQQKVSQEGSSQQASFLLPQSLERLNLMNCNISDTDYFPLTFKDQSLLIYLNLVNSLFELLPSYNHLKRLRVLDASGCSDLKELRCLPGTLAELYIYYCNSLTIVTFESHRFTLQEFGYEGCVNLCEVEGLFKLMPLTKLEESDLKHLTWVREYQDLKVCLVGDAELTKGRSSCIQMLYEFNIISTSLPNIKNSNLMTDTDYMYASQSTLLSFKVPACPEHKRLEGLIITFQYTAHGEDWVWFAKITTPSGVNMMYNPSVFGKPDEIGMWSSYWPIGKALQIEDTVTVSIIVIKGLDIHWCGANLVYTDDGANEPLQKNKECAAILGEDFSEFQLSTGAYYLCRRDFFELMEAGELTPDWFGILVDDEIDYAEVGGWRMTGKPEHPYQSYTEVKTIKCIMYGPEMEDFYKIAELSKSSLVDKTRESTTVPGKVKIITSFSMFIANGDGKEPESSSLKLPLPCRSFEFSEIELATKNFDESLVIGHGGFGKVYKGNVIIGSSPVVAAIKRLDPMSRQGAAELWTEVEVLSHLRHSNLVSLIGHCVYEEEMILLYEYMPNGTLADHLHKLGTYLSWIMRLKICIGAGRGLDYLHTGTGIEVGVIHRDFKSSNILLHEKWAAKISDFGLSKIGPKNQPSTYVNTHIKGSFGYIDPSYFATGRLSRKSDVYAFGVLLLEVLCKKHATYSSLDGQLCGLAAWAQQCIKDGKLKHIIDSDIKSEISSKCLKKFVQIAERCLHSSPKQRPTMAEVVVILESVLTLQEKFGSLLQLRGRTMLGKMAGRFSFPSKGENSAHVDSSNNEGNSEIAGNTADLRILNPSLKAFLNERRKGNFRSWI